MDIDPQAYEQTYGTPMPRALVECYRVGYAEALGVRLRELEGPGTEDYTVQRFLSLTQETIALSRKLHGQDENQYFPFATDDSGNYWTFRPCDFRNGFANVYILEQDRQEFDPVVMLDVSLGEFLDHVRRASVQPRVDELWNASGSLERVVCDVYLAFLIVWLVYLIATLREPRDERFPYFFAAASPLTTYLLIRAMKRGELRLRGVARREDHPLIFWFTWLLMACLQFGVIVYLIDGFFHGGWP